MAFKPDVTTQLDNQTGMGRPGGITSMASTPKVMAGTMGQNFAAMENSLLKGMAPNPNALSVGKPGRQYINQAAGIGMKVPKPPKMYNKVGKIKKLPSMMRMK